MPNIKSAKKRVLTSEKSRQRNVARRSEIKTAIRKIDDAVNAHNFEEARTLLRDAEAKIARAASKGVVKAETASRKISRLAQGVKKAALAKPAPAAKKAKKVASK